MSQSTLPDVVVSIGIDGDDTASDDSGSSLLHDSYSSRYVIKNWDGKPYKGTVIGYHENKVDGKLYRVLYEDGDKEDYDETELQHYCSEKRN